MSVNRYNPTTGELTNIAAGQRTWIGTKQAYEAAKTAGMLPNNAMICITDDCNENNYSTDEKLTGSFWIDGKPIYRKTIYVYPVNSNADTTIEADSSYIDTFVKCEGFCKYHDTTNTNRTTYPLPYIATGAYSYVMFGNAKNLVLRNNTGWGGYDLYCTIYYTKTTD